MPLDVATPEAADAAAASLAAAPAVVVLTDEADRTTLVATTADARRFISRRLGSLPDEHARPSGAEQRGLARSATVYAVGSAFEADLVYLSQTRLRLPHIHRLVVERWRPWFVHVDPEAEHPAWRKTNLAPETGDASAPGILLGPIPDKDSAGRLMETMIDAFDLCREHRLLVQAPHALACPYKQMGRCPAPCDGSEPMAGYRERVAEAAAFAGGAPDTPGGLASSIARLESRMKHAADALEFECAAGLKRLRDRLERLAKPKYAHVASLDRFRWLIVMPAPKRGAARVFHASTGGVEVLEDAAPDEAAAAAERLASRARADAVPDQTDVESIAVVSRWLGAPKSRRKGSFLRVNDGLDASAVAQAIRAICRPRRAIADALGEVEDREIGAG